MKPVDPRRIATDGRPVGFDPVCGFSDVPDGVWRPIVVRRPQPQRLDLTGDRPLTRSEARKLARWWQGNGWSASLIQVRRNRFRVTAVR